jgi:N-acetylmuramoyl-L-alanine amidase
VARRCAEALVAGVVALILLHIAAPALAGEPVVAARLWPSPDYTRLTLETRNEIKYSVFSVADPERLVLDLQGVDFGPALESLPRNLRAEDPFIAQLRAGRNRPGVVRVVLELKQVVRAQAFTLRPVAQYGHRLVLDLYPLVPPDPLAALIALDGKVPKVGVAPKGKADDGDAGAPRSDRLAMIVIDPGHGGEDPGARGRRGTQEKDVTLLIARRLKAHIDAEPGMRALLTRDSDYYLPLQVRVDKARRVKADLLVSIHADAYIRPHAHGSSVFALSERRATSEAARWLAKKENEADLIGGVNLDGKDRYLAQTLLDLSQTATIDHSLRLGNAVLAELGTINTLHKPRVEQASFAVLKAPDIPSILVETAFISNPSEEKRLNDRAYQDRLARAILAGIKQYLKKHPLQQRPTLAALPGARRGRSD